MSLTSLYDVAIVIENCVSNGTISLVVSTSDSYKVNKPFHYTLTPRSDSSIVALYGRASRLQILLEQ